jgi:hypothetical protein
MMAARRLAVFLLLLAFQVEVFAQALPMSTAVAAAIKAKAGQRGFAANDPKIGITLTNVGSGIAGAALSAAVISAAAVTAPAWITAAAGAGLTALLGYGINLAVDSAIKWWKHSDGTYSQTGSPSSISSYYLQPYTGGSVQEVVQKSSDAIAAGYVGLTYGYKGVVSGCNETSCTITATPTGEWASWKPTLVNVYTPTPSYVAGVNPSHAPIQQVYDALPASEKSKDLSPQVVASIANDAWQKAAASGAPNVIPFDAANPITAADAAAVKAADPSAWPKVGDLVKPQAQVANQPSPFAMPSSSTGTTTGTETSTTTTGTVTNTYTTTNTTNNTTLDLGPNPNIGPPTLEDTPTAGMVLDPLKSLMPSLRNYVYPAGGGFCPNYSFNVFGHAIDMVEHCDLFRGIQFLLKSMMLVVFTLRALFIVLSA